MARAKRKFLLVRKDDKEWGCLSVYATQTTGRVYYIVSWECPKKKLFIARDLILPIRKENRSVWRDQLLAKVQDTIYYLYKDYIDSSAIYRDVPFIEDFSEDDFCAKKWYAGQEED
ncbi:MAG: hypothetical protein IJG83_04455 [Thermoguttaceae bacterium]|nr:hypothetical protein [Thermoguttaceae bacterium]